MLVCATGPLCHLFPVPGILSPWPLHSWLLNIQFKGHFLKEVFPTSRSKEVSWIILPNHSFLVFQSIYYFMLFLAFLFFACLLEYLLQKSLKLVYLVHHCILDAELCVLFDSLVFPRVCWRNGLIAPQGAFFCPCEVLVLLHWWTFISTSSYSAALSEISFYCVLTPFSAFHLCLVFKCLWSFWWDLENKRSNCELRPSWVWMSEGKFYF